MFELKFDTDSSAFCDYETEKPDPIIRSIETRRILNKIDTMLRAGFTEGPVMDLNGNKIGSWKFTD